nr:hypothetical protein [Kibdelosporangium sp. MJ126-NF4]CTQ92154.1 hypothetical protein [Kibdelosporangium sp. MJ126-NF4]
MITRSGGLCCDGPDHSEILSYVEGLFASDDEEGEQSE